MPRTRSSSRRGVDTQVNTPSSRPRPQRHRIPISPFTDPDDSFRPSDSQLSSDRGVMDHIDLQDLVNSLDAFLPQDEDGAGPELEALLHTRYRVYRDVPCVRCFKALVKRGSNINVDDHKLCVNNDANKACVGCSKAGCNCGIVQSYLKLNCKLAKAIQKAVREFVDEDIPLPEAFDTWTEYMKEDKTALTTKDAAKKQATDALALELKEVKEGLDHINERVSNNNKWIIANCFTRSEEAYRDLLAITLLFKRKFPDEFDEALREVDDEEMQDDEETSQPRESDNGNKRRNSSSVFSQRTGNESE